MRPIKFRAWNGEVMISPDYINRNGLAHWKEDSIPTTSDKLMQFTGLLDKKGNEIYEGDIIRGLHDFGPGGMHERIGVISWENERGYRWSYWDMETVEVIGNIYESKHLLKETPNE
jgi:hypothetical protein